MPRGYKTLRFHKDQNINIIALVKPFPSVGTTRVLVSFLTGRDKVWQKKSLWSGFEFKIRMLEDGLSQRILI